MRAVITAGLITIALCVSTAVQADETIQLKGTVTGPDGKPVDDAAVSIYVLGVDTDRMSYDVRLAGQTKTCSSGLFSHAIEGFSSMAMGGAVLCYAEKPGLSLAFAYAHSEQIALKMTAPHTLSGRIEDARGNPVPDASVQLPLVSIPGGEMNFAFGLDPIPFFTVPTNAQGRFTFENLPEHCTAEFLVKKPGLAPFHSLTSDIDPQSGLTFSAGQDDIVLTLPDACTITGIVTDPDNNPVGNVTVLAIEPDIPLNLVHSPAQTNDDGTFTLNDLAPGAYTLRVADPDWISEPVTVDVRTELGVPIKVSRGVLLTVTVTDGITEKPVHPAHVQINSQAGRGIQATVLGPVDQDGKFQKRLAPGTYNIYASAPGYRGVQTTAVAVEDGAPADITITLGATAKITGTVADPAGSPLAGAAIFVLPSSGAPMQSRPTSDENGAFVLGWDPQQTPWTDGEFFLVAMHRDKNLAIVESIGEDTNEIALKLRPGHTLTGKVIAPDSSAIPNARVDLQFRGSRFSTSILQQQIINTDTDGVFTITAIPPEQQYYVSVTGPQGYGTASQSIDLADGLRMLTLPDISLKLANLTVTGKVVDADDTPVEGVRVQCHGDGQPNLNVTTDKDGRFTFDAVCEGPLRLNAWLQKDGDYLNANLATEGGAQDVTLVLTPQSSSGRYVPRRPASLVGKPLPDLSGFGLEMPTEARPTLVCVWDWRQRPSRHAVQQLAERADTLSQNAVRLVLLHAEPADRADLKKWLADRDISAACGVIEIAPDSARFNLGVQALPWLILAGPDRTVIAEGFSLSELPDKLEDLK